MAKHTFKHNLRDGVLIGLALGVLLVMVNLAYITLLPEAYGPTQLIVMFIAALVLILTPGWHRSTQEAVIFAIIRKLITLLIGFLLFAVYAFIFVSFL